MPPFSNVGGALIPLTQLAAPGKIDGTISKCYVIGATEDKLHDVEETKGITDSIQNAEYIDLKTNSAAHEQPLIDLLLGLY